MALLPLLSLLVYGVFYLCLSRVQAPLRSLQGEPLERWRHDRRTIHALEPPGSPTWSEKDAEEPSPPAPLVVSPAPSF